MVGAIMTVMLVSVMMYDHAARGAMLEVCPGGVLWRCAPMIDLVVMVMVNIWTSWRW